MFTSCNKEFLFCCSFKRFTHQVLLEDEKIMKKLKSAQLNYILSRPDIFNFSTLSTCHLGSLWKVAGKKTPQGFCWVTVYILIIILKKTIHKYTLHCMYDVTLHWGNSSKGIWSPFFLNLHTILKCSRKSSRPPMTITKNAGLRLLV